MNQSMKRVIGVVERQMIEQTLVRIRAALQSNGSDIELGPLENNRVKITLRGRVVESLGSVMLLRIGIERSLRTEVPGFGEVLTEFPQESGTGSCLLINL